MRAEDQPVSDEYLAGRRPLLQRHLEILNTQRQRKKGKGRKFPILRLRFVLGKEMGDF